MVCDNPDTLVVVVGVVVFTSGDNVFGNVNAAVLLAISDTFAGVDSPFDWIRLCLISCFVYRKFGCSIVGFVVGIVDTVD